MDLFIPFLTCIFVTLEVSGFQHFMHQIIRKHMTGNISIYCIIVKIHLNVYFQNISHIFLISSFKKAKQYFSINNNIIDSIDTCISKII